MYNKDMKIITALIVIILVCAIAWYARFRSEQNPLNAQFQTGVATPIPDGFYKGSSPSVNVGDWKGKKFDVQNMSGINVFAMADGGEREQYVFKMVTTKGTRDRKLDVIKLDYNQPGNPWYLRWFAYDEMVRLSDGKYLGKIYLSVIPGFPVTVGYFWQMK
jgi:hypothetical protein